MNLYLIEQFINDRHDTYDYYDSAVVVAESEEDARTIHPYGDCRIPSVESVTDWANDPRDVKATFIGTAAPELKSGAVLCARFNAG